MVRKELKELVIDDLKEDDLDEVSAIEKDSFTNPWSLSLFLNELRNPKSIPRAARLDNRIVGYICANLILDEGHILNVTVHPQYRRLGIASALVGHILNLFRESHCLTVFLEVRASNLPAMNMYETNGFRIIGIRKNYYVSPSEDAVIMALSLK